MKKNVSLLFCLLSFAATCLFSIGGCASDSDDPIDSETPTEFQQPNDESDEPEDIPLYNDWEIVESTPLLNPDGSLSAWGWARHPLMEYDRERLNQAQQERLKEWDFYSVSSKDYCVSVTLANITWAVLVSVSILDYQTGEIHSNLRFPLNSSLLTMPLDPYESVAYERNGAIVAFEYKDNVRTLSFSFPWSFILGPKIKGKITIHDDPDLESLSTAMPFPQTDTFFYTSKIVALPASGSLVVGSREIVFPPDESFAVLDWGRGVWPSEFVWGWAVAAGDVNGKNFGFNIGFGEEDNSRTTGNSVVIDGVLHKLGEIDWSYDSNDIMKPWTFKSRDNRFDMVLEPFFDESGTIDLIVYSSDMIKVHGKVTGNVILDDGTMITVENILGFSEHCFQKW